MEIRFTNRNVYSPPVKWDCFTCGGGIFGFAKNDLNKESGDSQKGQTNAAAEPTDTSKYWGESGTGYDIDWEGSGTQSDPYKIQTAEELAGLSWRIYNGSVKNSSEASGSYYYQNVYFEQTANLDVSAYWWTPIGVEYKRDKTKVCRYFSGNYDGNGHVISGVFTKSGTSNEYGYQGVFGCVYGQSTSILANIANLGLINSNIQGDTSIGGLVGIGQRATIHNSYNSGTVNGADNYVGGIIGYSANVTIKNCYNAGSVNQSDGSHSGGILGYGSTGTLINNCYNLGSVSGANRVGGIVGGVYKVTLSDCFNVGSVMKKDTISGAYAGGVLGQNNSSSPASTITTCYYGGNCALTKGVGAGTDSTTRDTNLISNAKTLSWYKEASKWNSGSSWDFDNVWTFSLEINNGYPILKWQMPKYQFDVNGNLDGTISGTLENYATFDVYINGSRVATQVNDYCSNITAGASYQITNIKYAADKALVGTYYDNACTVSGSLRGTMPSEKRIVCLKLRTKTWNDYAASSFDSGNGTSSSPYIIKTAEQLAKVSKDSESKDYDDRHFRLAANIDLSGHEWYPIGDYKDYYFRGTFDGDFYAISNLKIEILEFDKSGLFGSIGYGGTGLVKNIIITNANITKGSHCGVIAGLVDSSGTITNCIVDNSSVQSSYGAYFVGGVCGWLWNSNITNCQVINSTISGGYAGGLFGYQGGSGGSTLTNNGCHGNTITGNSGYGALYGGYNNSATMNFAGSYAQGSVNWTASKVMYGESTAWDNWAYHSALNGGYPVQKSLFHIGGMSGGDWVYHYLKNILGFTAA